MVTQPGFTRSPHFDKVRRQLRATRLLPRRQNADERRAPDFLIIGGQKCGTTTLYRYLIEHPDVLNPLWKEIHYFDLNWRRGLPHYKAHFPLESEAAGKFAGEATPYYIHHPLVPGRVAQTVPNARLIAILREPADRAYSHYQHHVRSGRETAPTFEQALAIERSFLETEFARLQSEPNYYSYKHHHFTYFDRGVYVDQFRRWLEHFDREQILVVTLEELTSDTARVMHAVWKHIGLPDAALPSTTAHNAGSYNRPSADKLVELRAAYASHNDELRELMSLELPW